MAESIVVIRLTRNLRYKLTYIKIFEDYMEPNPGPEVVELLKSLIQAQQSAIAPLSSYLRRLDVNVQDLELVEKLLGHASSRTNVKARLRFIYDGLSRAATWYKTQLLDRQMTSDPELHQLLLELGEIDAAKLWRTEALMGMLKIPTRLKEKDWDEQPRYEPDKLEGWRPRLLEDVSRPAWSGSRSSEWSRLYKDTRDR
jgi:thioredoxin-like negative regulator of GroEL